MFTKETKLAMAASPVQIDMARLKRELVLACSIADGCGVTAEYSQLHALVSVDADTLSEALFGSVANTTERKARDVTRRMLGRSVKEVSVGSRQWAQARESVERCLGSSIEGAGVELAGFIQLAAAPLAGLWCCELELLGWSDPSDIVVDRVHRGLCRLITTVAGYYPPQRLRDALDGTSVAGLMILPYGDTGIREDDGRKVWGFLSWDQFIADRLGDEPYAGANRTFGD